MADFSGRMAMRSTLLFAVTLAALPLCHGLLDEPYDESDNLWKRGSFDDSSFESNEQLFNVRKLNQCDYGKCLRECSRQGKSVGSCGTDGECKCRQYPAVGNLDNGDSDVEASIPSKGGSRYNYGSGPANGQGSLLVSNQYKPNCAGGSSGNKPLTTFPAIGGGDYGSQGSGSNYRPSVFGRPQVLPPGPDGSPPDFDDLSGSKRPRPLPGRFPPGGSGYGYGGLDNYRDPEAETFGSGAKRPLSPWRPLRPDDSSPYGPSRRPLSPGDLTKPYDNNGRPLSPGDLTKPYDNNGRPLSPGDLTKPYDNNRKPLSPGDLTKPYDNNGRPFSPGDLTKPYDNNGRPLSPGDLTKPYDNSGKPVSPGDLTKPYYSSGTKG